MRNLSRSKLGAFLAIAATVLVAVGVYAAWPWEQDHFATGVGEQLTFTLSDGTVVHLNTESELAANLTARTREIELLRGEALFNVAKDRNRPFIVNSGAVVVQALGTQFNVYRRNDTTNVTVVEGKVAVLPRHEAQSLQAQPDTAPTVDLTATNEAVYVAGQQAVAHPYGEITRVDQPDIEKSMAWRERRLVFRGDRLDAIAREFNRYNRRKLEIRGDALESRELTATFDADDPGSLVSFLAQDPAIDVVYQSRRIVIRVR